MANKQQLNFLVNFETLVQGFLRERWTKINTPPPKSFIQSHHLYYSFSYLARQPHYLRQSLLTLILRGGGANMPHNYSNAYTSGTECRIDLKPGCKFELVRCLNVFEK